MDGLQAEEDIRLSNAVALGSGTMKKSVATRMRQDLAKRLRGKKKVNKLPTKIVAQMHGIGFIEEGKKDG